MYKQLFLAVLVCGFASQPVLSDNSPGSHLQQCPDITIVSLNPLKIKPLVGWEVTIQEIAPESYGNETPLLEDVIPYETHVLSDYIDTGNQAQTVTLSSCQYGLHWQKYNKNLYGIEAGTTKKLIRAMRSQSEFNKTSLIMLTPTRASPIVMSIDSIEIGNYTGWTRQRANMLGTSTFGTWGVWYDCYHDRITDPKCTWLTVPTVRPAPLSQPDYMNLFP